MTEGNRNLPLINCIFIELDNEDYFAKFIVCKLVEFIYSLF